MHRGMAASLILGRPTLHVTQLGMRLVELVVQPGHVGAQLSNLTVLLEVGCRLVACFRFDA